MAIEIKSGDLDDPCVIQLLGIHLSNARMQTAPGSAHALDLCGLRAPGIRLWTAWDGDSSLGTAALKRLSSEHGEIKSMHTAEAFRGRGVAGTLLYHLIETARAEGIGRLNLETGSWPYFAPAHRLYARHGFVDCGPFADYAIDPNSRFMTLDLRQAD